MTKERVDSLLAKYRYNVGRVLFLTTAIEESAALIEKARTEIILDAAMASGGEEGMPKNPNVSQTVENIALRLINGWTPEIIRQEEEALVGLEAELHERKREVQYVDGLLSGLVDKERWIIEKQVIGEATWHELSYEYAKQYHQQASKSTLKRLKECAMGKIYAIAE